MTQALKNKKIAFLVTDGFEQVELTEPWKEIENAGATIDLISLKEGKIQGFHHDEKADLFPVDKTINAVSASEYDGLVLPGGVHNPDALRLDKNAVAFV